MTRAYIGIGSNLGDRDRYISDALRRLDDGRGTTLLTVAQSRETDPVGAEEQPRFLNTVALIESALPARELLDRLLQIERDLGRERRERWGPRTIDLDLLLYGDEVIDDDGLTVPHPRLHERRFVLEPLAELAPTLVVPSLGPVEDLLAELD